MSFFARENVPMTKEVAMGAGAVEIWSPTAPVTRLTSGVNGKRLNGSGAAKSPSLQVFAIERNPAALRPLDANRQRLPAAIDIPGSANDHNRESRCGVYGRQRGHLTALDGLAMGHLHPGGQSGDALLSCRKIPS